MRERIWWIWLLAAAGTLACGSEPPPAPSPATCTVDTDCPLGQLCYEKDCVAAARLDCVPQGAEAPAIAVASRVDFGETSGATLTHDLKIENTGSCTLSVVQARLEADQGTRFACPGCAVDRLPLSVYPGREAFIPLQLNPGAAGDFEDALLLESNDPELPRLRVRLFGRSSGTPTLTVEPTRVDFGFVPAASQVDRVVRVVNSGIGTATLTISSAELTAGDVDVFSLSPPVTAPVSLAPARVDATAGLALTVTYAPTMAAQNQATLTITPEIGAPVAVTLVSDARPPDISADTNPVNFQMVDIGQTERRRITIQNRGMSPLVATAALERGTSPDLSLPLGIPPSVDPGGVAEMVLVFAPTVAGTVQDRVIIQSNDPDQPTVAIPVTGTGVAIPGEAVTVQMRFSNDSSSFLDLDIRNVDLILEAPDGRVCSKAVPGPDWGPAGRCTWAATGPRNAYERTLLTSAMNDGEYTVRLSYVEDCASLPTTLAANLLGIGTEALVDAISEGEVAVNPMDISNVVEELCVDRRSTTAVVTVSINGQQRAMESVRLDAKGAFMPAVKLVRSQGRFSVGPP